MGDCIRSPQTSADARIQECSNLIVGFERTASQYLSEAYLRRGHAYLNKGQYESAIADYDKVLGGAQVSSDLIMEASLQRGVAYAVKGDMQRAQTDVEKAFDLTKESSPQYPRVAMIQGLLTLVKGGYVRNGASKLLELVDADVGDFKVREQSQ
jgi:tetratricopeptide (TPR) repeat protein